MEWLWHWTQDQGGLGFDCVWVRGCLLVCTRVCGVWVGVFVSVNLCGAHGGVVKALDPRSRGSGV